MLNQYNIMVLEVPKVIIFQVKMQNAGSACCDHC